MGLKKWKFCELYCTLGLNGVEEGELVAVEGLEGGTSEGRDGEGLEVQ